MRGNQANQIQSHHILDEMQSIKHNTHSHLHIKIHEQLSHFVLDAYFIQDVRSKNTLGFLSSRIFFVGFSFHF